MTKSPLNSNNLQAPLTFSRNAFGEKYIYAVNRETFNKIGSQAFLASHFGEILKKEKTLYIVVGTDSGLLIKHVIANGIPEGSRFLFIEFPEIIGLIKQTTDWQEYSSCISCVPYDTWSQQAEKFRINDYVYLNSIKLVKSTGAGDASLPDYIELFDNIRQEVDFHYWAVSGLIGNELFIYRQFENLAENRLPAVCLKNTFKGQTAVILAGGPSLDEAIPWVKANQDKLVVMAVSRICRRLIDTNLTPDIVFSVDPKDLSFDTSKDMLDFPEPHPLLVNQFHVNTHLLGQWPGKNLFLGDRFPWTTKMNVETLPTAGPTVTNTALRVGLEMGFSKIILAGVDLCYSREGYTHAKGSSEYKAGPRLGQFFAKIETNGGWLANTTSDFSGAAKTLTEQAKDAVGKNCTLINPSINAAKIENITYTPLDRIDLPPGNKSIKEKLAEIVPQETPEDRLKYYKNTSEELRKAYGNLLQIKKLAIEALRCNDGLFGRKGLKADFKYKKRMDQIEKTLNKKFKKFTPLVKTLGLKSFLKLTRLDKEKEWDDEEIEKTGRAYYEAYRDTADELIKLTEKARQRLACRAAEERDNPDFNLLIKQWEEDEQPGRVLIWKNRHREHFAKIPAKIRKKFDTLEKTFHDMLAETDTRKMRESKQYAELTNVKTRAFNLFKQNALQDLQDLKEALTIHPDANARPLSFLAAGYAYELEDRTDQAFAEYEKAAEYEAFQEESLRRMTALGLKQNKIDITLNVFKKLIDIAPVYMVQYAELLKLTGNHESALNTYADYLEKFPDDLTTMLKVGMYYRELQIEEGARLMFKHILDKDPNNIAARTLLSEIDQ